ncbi:MAG: 1-deoxy-D-xylulose-5-phosphate synthase, partial [Microlunatus sp.]|nr:1-deoxy-D-xylulose-5-phosphate synthase [Microlunatus sp.]
MTAEQAIRLPGKIAEKADGDQLRPRAPRLLNRISGPEDLRTLSAAQLPELAEEIRRLLIQVVTRNGGHLGPNLGVVELTIALHRVFCSPWDPIVWDTGHQSYVHKLLTGRRDCFGELRQLGGLSGYPSRGESVHDLVENSHASTALSYADGLAKGLALQGQRGRRVVAVVGDGAMTGGLCWEALNNIGAGGRPLVIVLNDNTRAYSPTVGSLAGHLARLRAGDREQNLFELLGLDYLGPIDGHDIGRLEQALATAKAADRPVLVHCVTRKGCGYRPAETDEADRLHTVSPAPRPVSALAPKKAAGGPAWTDVFAGALLDAAQRRPDLVGVTAAMPLPTGLGPLAERFPDRVYDVGIAEQHAVISAAGLAMAGLHPVVAVYSTFLNRAFDQVLLDVALHRLGVTFVLDRSGITGPDGPSHHGIWDVGLLGLVPGLEVAAPRDADQVRELFEEAIAVAAPRAIRFPRGKAPAPMPAHRRIGRADLLTAPNPAAPVAILAVGPLCAAALSAADRLAGDGID